VLEGELHRFACHHPQGPATTGPATTGPVTTRKGTSHE
jgi:hypothetical protein